MEEMLEKAGLTKNEAKVYQALLNLNLSSAKPIIDETRLHRQVVYDSLSSLIEKGFASFVIQANRKYFKASSPSQLLSYFDSKEEEIAKEREYFVEFLKSMEQ